MIKRCIYCNKELEAGRAVDICNICMYITEVRSENVVISELNPNTPYKNGYYKKSAYFENHLNRLRNIKKPKNGFEYRKY